MTRDATDPPASADSRAASDPPPTIASVPESRTSSELWRRVEEVFQQVVGIDSAEERAARLERECGTDLRIRREVEQLLAADDEASGSLEQALVGGLKLFSAEEPSRRAGEAGQRIGPYRVIRTLGEGGMGKVLLAARADSEFEQLVALKLIRPGMGSDRIIERFRRERQILANLVHPNIARLLDGGTTEAGLPYLVMEHIEGEPIDAYCDTRKLGISQRLELFRTVCGAVAYAHRNLVVHRDLKPANILVTPGGTVKLLDFGIAKLLSPEEAALTGSHDLTAFERPLTPGYASPEQVAGSWVSTASDVYSLGVVLYRLLSGRRPYRTGGLPPREAERRVLEEEPPLPSVAVLTPPADAQDEPSEAIADRRGTRPEALARRLRGDLDNIILAALEKEPAKRYTTIEPFARDLENHLVGLPISARQATFAYRAGKMLLRHRVGAAVAAAFAVVLIVSGIGLHLQAQAAARERDTAEAVIEFMLGLFESTNPEDTRSQDITGRELLDRGKDRIDESLTEPVLRARMLDTVGQLYHELGHFDEAQEELRKALELRRARRGRGARKALAATLTYYADTLRRLERHDEAEGAYLEAGEILRALPGEHSAELVGVENGLGLLYRAMDRGEEAEPHLRAALALHEAAGAEDDGELAAVLANLGLVLADGGLYQQAEELLDQALEIDRRVFGESHPTAASDLHNLGRIHFSLGEFPEAERLYREALAIREEWLDPQHPALLETKNSLAATLFRLGELEEPETLFRQVLEFRRSRLGPRNTQVATSLNNLATVIETRGNYAVAEELFRESLDIRREMYVDQKHRAVTRSALNLGKILLLRGDSAAAEPLLAEAVETVEELRGPGHPALAGYYVGMAALRRDQGRLDEAIELQRRAVEIQLGGERGAQHPNAAVAQAELGALLARVGQVEEAARLYQRAIAVQREQLAPLHLDLATTLVGQGEVMALRGMPTAAEELAREALRIRLEHLEPDDWRVGEAESILGAALARRGNRAEASVLLETGLAKLTAGRGPEHVLTALAQRRHAAAREGLPQAAAVE